ncbi:MAG: hypothetical protein QNJ51_11540 [Calothrix sp. MO_167.B12]|nr:hypothetical protein [Calothrix sp. MO_167.B12]
MDINLEGRVNNISLHPSKALSPLFEAISNSIHAIEDRNINNGYIDIQIKREVNQTGLIDDGNFSPIDSFIIIDNGVGFDSNNLKSFYTSDSLYKKSRGSKGIGRLLWLKAFTDVFIESIYENEGGLHKRNLEFNFQNNGVKQISDIRLYDEDIDIYTKIEFKNFLSPYRGQCPQKIETIGKKIIEHYISYFVLEKVPKIRLVDGKDEFDINNYFDDNLEPFTDENVVKIKGHDFHIKSIKYYDYSDSNHKLYYCANNRTVFFKQLHNFIPDLVGSQKIEDSDSSKKFTYLAFVRSTFFDENVNQGRTGFNNIIDKHEGFTEQLGLLTNKEIEESLVDSVYNNLHPFLENIKEAKEKEIQDYIMRNALEYRPLLKYARKQLDSIKPGLSHKKLDLELHKIKSELELSLKKQGQEILNTPLENFDKYPEYRQQYHSFLEKYNDLGINKLAEYVVHRKIIIELFSKNLERDDRDRYSLESDIHEIVFPMRATSDEINSFEKQNLWLIDERLSYHHYLASDKPLGQLPNFTDNSSSRPDILIFNNPIVFVEDERPPYSSVTIVEFKRPMRKNYDDNQENPISQVASYISQIRENTYTDKNGKLIRVRETTPFYVFVICDLTKKIRYILEDVVGYTKMPDDDGYFNFNRNSNAYIEVLSFDKVVRDAKLRNSILFKKLGI